MSLPFSRSSSSLLTVAPGTFASAVARAVASETFASASIFFISAALSIFVLLVLVVVVVFSVDFAVVLAIGFCALAGMATAADRIAANTNVFDMVRAPAA